MLPSKKPVLGFSLVSNKMKIPAKCGDFLLCRSDLSATKTITVCIARPNRVSVWFVPFIAAMMIAATPAVAKGKGGARPLTSSHAAASSKSTSAASHPNRPSTTPRPVHNTNRAQGVARDAKGKIARSGEARAKFEKSHPCPSTGRTSGACPGYVVDHIKPLKRGGADSPSNMQWQTTAAAKAKDKWE